MKQEFSIKQRTAGSFLLIAIGIGFLYLWNSTSPTRLTSATNDEAAKKMVDAPSIAPQSSTKTILELAQKKAAAADLALEKSTLDTEKTILTEKKAKEIWKTADKNTKEPSVPLAALVKEYQAIELDPEPESYPSIGDQVTLPMLNGKRLVADVEDVTLNQNGDYTWSGHISGAGSDYLVVFTYGAQSTFATISTADGSFSLEAVNGSGWLYKNPSMSDMAATNRSDTLEPLVQH